MRKDEEGWVELACPDGRRGVWMRVTSEAIELCAGREGDDVWLQLCRDRPVTEQNLSEAFDILQSLLYSKELSYENTRMELKSYGRLEDE